MAYIKKEVVIDKFEKLQKRAETMRDKIYLDGVLAVIENIPTAEVQEVKHGEWKEIKCGDEIFDYYFKCSNCGNTTPPKAFPVAPDYCPHCGAKMDGGI